MTTCREMKVIILCILNFGCDVILFFVHECICTKRTIHLDDENLKQFRIPSFYTSIQSNYLLRKVVSSCIWICHDTVHVRLANSCRTKKSKEHGEEKVQSEIPVGRRQKEILILFSFILPPSSSRILPV